MDQQTSFRFGSDKLGIGTAIGLGEGSIKGVLSPEAVEKINASAKIQLIDITGKLIQSKEVNVNNSQQIEEVRIPRSVSAGNYLLKVNGLGNNVSVTNKIVIQ